MIRSIRPLLVWSLLALLLGAVPAQAQSTLEEYQKRQEVAAQALEKDVRDAVAQARRQKADAPAALKILDDALGKLSPSDPLQIAKRAELRNLIEATIKEIKYPSLTGKPSLMDRLPPSPREVEELIKTDIATILELQKQGKMAEAEALASKLVAEHPALVEAQQTKTVLGQGQAASDAEKIRQAKADGNRSALNSVDRSATPIVGDYHIDPEIWRRAKEREKKLQARLAPKTDREKELLRWLNTPISSPIALRNQPFEQALQFIEKELGMGFFLSKRTLDELRIDYSTPVSLTIPRGASRGAVLSSLLEQLGMTHIIKNEQICLVSKEEASKTLVTRIVPVDSLVGGVVSNMTPEQLIRYIEDTVEPDSWKRNDGAGTISYFPGARVLIIRNSAAVISILDKGL